MDIIIYTAIGLIAGFIAGRRWCERHPRRKNKTIREV